MMKKEELAIGEAHPFDAFDIGDQVKHPKWGVGTILFRSGSGESAKVIVVFPEEGQKKLALKYAKLKKQQDSKPAVTVKDVKAAKAAEPVKDEAPAKDAEKKDKDAVDSADEVEEANDSDDSDDEDEILLPEDVEEDISFGDDEDEKNLEVLGSDDKKETT